MTGPLLPALLTAGVLGVTHAMEPDHVAGISSLTSDYGDSRLSALAGACFSVGHVVLVVAWLAVAYVLLGRTSFPAVYGQVGTLGVGVLLGVFGAAMAVGGLRRVVRSDEHAHDGVTHSHPHVRLPLPGFDGADHGHDTVSYLKTGLVGALFTLSPPVSMIVFASTLLPGYGADVVALAVLTYGVTITATMSLLGAGAGALFGLAKGRNRTVHGFAQTVAGVAVTGLAATLLVDAAPALL
ncbi:hypothetical protein EGH21_03930 [Halomicroarcula sp. F13]|uniref:Nickel/cobalt efflux system n=1 Tax=Haloarcula rubra TaxID=2487747 RepID=A0AAW4PKW6_9EURY|nr:hypothetical protein [Halomicroarcula rubra]MBX0322178.1 hypothetical protein [Halomicroarcula rubra]